MLTGTWIIFRREMLQYFVSPIAYLIAFGFLLTTALLFNGDLLLSINTQALDVTLIPNYLMGALTFFAPLLTMRLLAEERRETTLELLLTAPVDEMAIVLGKFLGAWAFYTLLLLLTFSYQLIILSLNQSPDLARSLSAHIGIWLYGGATLAIGMVFSALTENQIVAGFLATAALTLLYAGDLAGQVIANIEIARLVRELTLPGHFSTSFAAGLVRGEDIVYFCGLIVVMLYITIQIVGSHRWR
jgi:ABC-2 type transport system permease protein